MSHVIMNLAGLFVHKTIGRVVLVYPVYMILLVFAVPESEVVIIKGSEILDHVLPARSVAITYQIYDQLGILFIVYHVVVVAYHIQFTYSIYPDIYVSDQDRKNDMVFVPLIINPLVG